MAVMFTSLSWWLWSGRKGEDPTIASPASSLNSSLNLRELETMRFASSQVKMQSASRRVKRKWHSREERRIDREYDIVLVPSDGGCLSGSESDGSDWSIGWMEPHALDFQSSDEMDTSFAVLVPCYYSHGRKEHVDTSKNQLPSAIAKGHSAESKGILEQWLSSLQNS